MNAVTVTDVTKLSRAGLLEGLPSLARAVVGEHDLNVALRAVVPHAEPKIYDDPQVLFQFSDDHLVVFAHGGYSVVAARVPVREVGGLTGDPSSDRVLVPGAAVKRLAALFKAPRRDGGPVLSAEVELSVEPNHENRAVNRDVEAAATDEGRQVREEELKSPATLHVKDVSGLFPGQVLSVPTTPRDVQVSAAPVNLAGFMEPTSTPNRAAVSVSASALAAFAASGRVLADETVLTPRGEGSFLVTIGHEFTGILPASTRSVDAAKNDTAWVDAWADVLREVTA